jgi:hypothetical protein
VPELHAGDPAWIGPFRLRERLGDGDGDGAGSLGPLYLGQSPLAHLVTIRWACARTWSPAGPAGAAHPRRGGRAGGKRPPRGAAVAGALC